MNKPFLAVALIALAGLVPAIVGTDHVAADKPASQPADARQVITVSTAREFLHAIGPDRIIVLRPGEYDLSAVKRAKLKHVRWTSPLEDQYQVEIRDVPNLSIRGDANSPAHVKTPYRYAYVLTFRNAPGLELSNLRIGHGTKPGYCCGGVVQVFKTRGATIDKCTLYGCGTEGLHLENVKKLTVRQSVIEDCTYGLLSAKDCESLHFVDTVFRKTVEFYGFDLTDCTDVRFKNCRVLDNAFGSELLGACLFRTNLQTDDAIIHFTGGQIANNKAERLVNEPGMLKLADTKVSGNSWQK